MNKSQEIAELHRMLKVSFIDSVETSQLVKDVKGTDIEPMIILNVISNLYKLMTKTLWRKDMNLV